MKINTYLAHPDCSLAFGFLTVPITKDVNITLHDQSDQPHAVDVGSLAILDAVKLATTEGENLNQICDVMETSNKKIPNTKL